VEKWIALMGKRYTPADGVEDYCTFLGHALARRGLELEQVRVSWPEDGWDAALQSLARQAEKWRGQWVLLQYTALAWSSRGFPFGALRVLDVLRRSGARVGVVFHEYCHQDGARPSPVRPVRAACQEFVIRRAHKRAALSIFTIPTNKISWARKDFAKSAFIPIGANIPEPSGNARKSDSGDPAEKTVAVFSFTPGARLELETADIAHAVRKAQASGHKIHLVIFGTGSDEARPKLEQALAGSGVRVSILGLIPAEDIAVVLSQADAQLFVRGSIAQTRGSALAGIACGLPIIAYAGAAEGTTIEEAGIELVPYRDREALADALLRVLSNRELRENLRRRSFEAQRKYFSWDAIASRYAAACVDQTAGERDTASVIPNHA
jgi:glycosyltransferase involved in cell wall biosynthesis